MRGMLGLAGDPPTSNLDPPVAGACGGEEPVELEIAAEHDSRSLKTLALASLLVDETRLVCL